VVWRSGSALASINEVNLRRARLVLRWATVSGFSSRCRTLISICNQPTTKANSAFHPSGVGKWVPASAEKAKAGMVHSVGGCTRGVQVKLWDPLRTRAVPERLRGVFTTRRYTNPRLPYLTWKVKVSPMLVGLNWSRTRQSACRWEHAVMNPAVGCHYLPPDLQLPSQPSGITALRPVPTSTAC